MPITKKYGIDELMEACKYYEDKTKRRITIEYTLIKDVNDDLRNADELIKILKGLNAHVNLIPLNPIEEYGEGRSSNKHIKNFERILSKANINTTIRREMGSDISASCGQLRRAHIDK